MIESSPFVFYTERRLVSLTGLKVRNLSELLSALREVSGAAIFYHTHHQYLSHHFEKPMFYNDFALWVSHALQEERLAEKLAAIDLLTFTTVRQLREAIITTIASYLSENNGRSRECPPGDEFHFCKSMSFVMPTGIMAHDVPDFFAKLPHITNVSLYFHFFEARLRLERPTNDFSRWLADGNQDKLARAIEKLDPYIMTLDELKSEIIKLGKQYLEG
ncbi:DUF5752 family protein [candidate division KSB1 bacterium]|nr:DUF5752 family protein [candidate division KSB1 bacterium]